jgi:hypothetical protein
MAATRWILARQTAVTRVLLVGLVILGLPVRLSGTASAVDGVKTASLSLGVNWGEVLTTSQPMQVRLRCDASATMFGFALTDAAYESSNSETYDFYPGFAPMVFPVEVARSSQCRMTLDLRNNFDNIKFDVMVNGALTPVLLKDRRPYVDFTLAGDTSINVVVKNPPSEERTLIDKKPLVQVLVRLDSGQGDVYGFENITCDSTVSTSRINPFRAPRSSSVLYYSPPTGVCTFSLNSALPDFATKLVLYVNGSSVTPTPTPTGVSFPVTMVNSTVRVHAILPNPTPVRPVLVVPPTSTTPQQTPTSKPTSKPTSTTGNTTVATADSTKPSTKPAKSAKTTTTKPARTKATANSGTEIRKVALTISANYADNQETYTPLEAQLVCVGGRVFGTKGTIGFLVYQGDKFNIEVEVAGNTGCELLHSVDISAVSINGTNVPVQTRIPLAMQGDTNVVLEIPPAEIKSSFKSLPGYTYLRTDFSLDWFGKLRYVASLGNCVDVLLINGDAATDAVIATSYGDSYTAAPPAAIFGRPGSTCVLTIKPEGFDLGSRLVLLYNGVPQTFSTASDGTVSFVVPFEDHVHVRGFIRPITPDEIADPRQKSARKSGGRPKNPNAKVDKNGCISNVVKSKDGKLVAIAKICPRKP